MENINQAINRIKKLQCPTGELENRVGGILEEYDVANINEITIKRDERLDGEGVEGYMAEISSNKDQSLVILAESGLDDYVAKVVDAYTN